MRPSPILPSAGFMLAFLCGGLLLLCYELLVETQDTGCADCPNWVLLETGDGGGQFLSARPGERLDQFVEAHFPGGAVSIPQTCEKVQIKAGMGISLRDLSTVTDPWCVVRSAPEGLRYLLGLPLNINRATEAELSLLPGIGPTLASRIFKAREDWGHFLSPAGLMRVKGIGTKLSEKILESATLEPGDPCICTAKGPY